MVIEKVHGLQATSMTLNDRFTLLTSAAPDRNVRQQPRRRPYNGSGYNQNLNARNWHLIQQIARNLEWQRKRQALRQRIGEAACRLRRFGSENSLLGLRHSNSYGNLNQNFNPLYNIKSRLTWRQSNGNLSRSASSGPVLQSGRGRPLRRRGGAPRARFWGGRGARTSRGRRGPSSGRGMTRSQTPKPVPSKEELDAQLDQYMASSKSALDKELEEYMKSAMELEP